jgi:hypothetical protein
MFVFSVYRLVSRRCHNISTMYPLAPAPYETILSYHHYRGNDIIYYVLKSSIFIALDVLRTTGRHKHPDNPKNPPSKICMFQPDILKNPEKSNGLFFYRFANQTTYSLTGQKFLSSLGVTSRSHNGTYPFFLTSFTWTITPRRSSSSDSMPMTSMI